MATWMIRRGAAASPRLAAALSAAQQLAAAQKKAAGAAASAQAHTSAQALTQTLAETAQADSGAALQRRPVRGSPTVIGERPRRR